MASKYAVLLVLSVDKETYYQHTSTAIHHFYEKLFYLKDRMNTETAKHIAEQREQYMKNFVTTFLSEWDIKPSARIILFLSFFYFSIFLHLF